MEETTPKIIASWDRYRLVWSWLMNSRESKKLVQTMRQRPACIVRKELVWSVIVEERSTDALGKPSWNKIHTGKALRQAFAALGEAIKESHEIFPMIKEQLNKAGEIEIFKLCQWIVKNIPHVDHPHSSIENIDWIKKIVEQKQTTIAELEDQISKQTSTRTYIATIHKDADSDYGISFPDFPGCVTSGETLDEARDLATEVLHFHIEGMLADGLEIPEPSTLIQLKTCDDTAFGFMNIEVAVKR